MLCEEQLITLKTMYYRYFCRSPRLIDYYHQLQHTINLIEKKMIVYFNEIFSISHTSTIYYSTAQLHGSGKK